MTLLFDGHANPMTFFQGVCSTSDDPDFQLLLKGIAVSPLYALFGPVVGPDDAFRKPFATTFFQLSQLSSKDIDRTFWQSNLNEHEERASPTKRRVCLHKIPSQHFEENMLFQLVKKACSMKNFQLTWHMGRGVCCSYFPHRCTTQHGNQGMQNNMVVCASLANYVHSKLFCV